MPRSAMALKNKSASVLQYKKVLNESLGALTWSMSRTSSAVTATGSGTGNQCRNGGADILPGLLMAFIAFIGKCL